MFPVVFYNRGGVGHGRDDNGSSKRTGNLVLCKLKKKPPSSTDILFLDRLYTEEGGISTYRGGGILVVGIL